MHYELVEIVSTIKNKLQLQINKNINQNTKIQRKCNGIDIVNMIYYSSVINLIVQK